MKNPVTVIGGEKGFPGLDTTLGQGAQTALNTRRDLSDDSVALRGLPLTSTEATHGTADVRALYYHTRATQDTTPVRLTFVADKLYADDAMDAVKRLAVVGDVTRPLFWDGTEVVLPGAGKVASAQMGARSFFVERED